MLGMLTQATVGPQSTEDSSSNSAPKLRRDEDGHRVSEPANHPPKRARKQYRSRRSNQDGQDDNTRTFGCPTCPPLKSLSKSMDEWYSHQKRCHFPKQIWVCRSAGQKSCKIAPSKRQDNFRNHLKNTHGFTAGHELDFEVRKRTIKVNGLFHEKCGFCEQDLASWEASMLHIWEHVESGARMADWNHVCETDHELTANVHYEIPHEHSVLDKDSSDEDDPNDDDPNSGGSAGEKFDFGPYGGLDDFNFDQDFNGEDYDGGMGPADQENTLNTGFYMSRTNSPPSGTNVAIDQDASQPRSQSTLAEAESPTIEDGNSNQDPAAPGFQDFERKPEILDMLQHLFSNLRVSETPTTTELPTCKEENAGIQGVGPTTPQYMPNNTSGRADMLQLQREVTGYQVVFDCNGQWRIASPGRWSFRDKLSEGVSRIQIWHWKPLVGDLTTKLPVSSPIGSVLTPNSALSEISTTGEDKVNTGIKSQISDQEHSKTMYATAPPLPVIVIFTREKDKENRDICSYIRLERKCPLCIECHELTKANMDE